MATHCPVGFDVTQLRRHVLETYDRVARAPEGDFHFHRGPAYAVAMLGYDARELAALPDVATARFAGVGNPLAAGPIAAGETVLDHACGAGTDLLLAARRVGPSGRVIGIDLTPAMRDAAAAAARQAGLAAIVEIRAGVFEELPVTGGSVDVVLSNGVLNLSPDKRQVLREAFRVLRPGGRLHLADVLVRRELSLAARSDPELWAACIGGALTEVELFGACRDLGFVDARIVARHQSFAGTSAEARVAKDLEVAAVTIFARKPAREARP